MSAAPGDCPQHAGRHSENHRRPLDGVMAGLPANQSGAGRHKCPYCAYEAGFDAGLQRAGEIIRDFILKSARAGGAAALDDDGAA